MAELWPTTIAEPGYDFTESWDMALIESKKETGHLQTRPAWSEAEHMMRVYYPALSITEKTTIQEFFQGIGYGGSSFFYTHPGTAEVLSVRLRNPLSFQHIGVNLWALSMDLRVDE
jgi:hypothetical protein